MRQVFGLQLLEDGIDHFKGLGIGLGAPLPRIGLARVGQIGQALIGDGVEFLIALGGRCNWS